MTPKRMMPERPYTVLSCALSLDGYLDDASDRRLLLSCAADFARVDALRAASDAILVGATTIRRDNPRLLVRAPPLRDARSARGQACSPVRVTLTRGGDLEPSANFFTEGEATALVYCARAAAQATRQRAGTKVTVIDRDSPIRMDEVAEDLYRRGIRRLLVEGGHAVFTQFLTGNLVDELQLAVAPLFVGDPHAPRFVGGGVFPWRGGHRARLVETRMVDDVALLRYALSERFTRG